MTYTVQIIEDRLVETSDGSTAMPDYLLPGTFATYDLAVEAAVAEMARLHKDGKRAHYGILDEDGRPVGHA
jgi:hypothetical protein